MDSLLISLIDAAFFFVGRGFLRLLKALRAPTPEFGHWGSVVLGFVVSVILVCVVFLVSFRVQQ